MKRFITYGLIILCLVFAQTQFAAEINSHVGVEKKLGETVPLNLYFNDSNGQKVLLKDLVTKPTVIDFAYYKCTGICTPLMTEIADVVGKVDLKPGKDYNILTVSINPAETSADAENKKKEMFALINEKVPDASWRFLTGDSVTIKALTDAAGFHFEKQGNTFLHTGLLIFISKEGKICRYLEPGYDTQGNFQILPLDFKMSVIDAARGQAIPVIDQVLRFCFAFQPKNEMLVNYLFAGIGVFMLLMVGAFIKFVLLKRPKDNFVLKTNKMK